MHLLNLSFFHASLCERNIPLRSHLHFSWCRFLFGWCAFCTAVSSLNICILYWIDQQYLYFHFHLFKGKQLTIMMQNHNICVIANKQHKFIWCTYIHKSCFHVRKVHFTRQEQTKLCTTRLHQWNVTYWSLFASICPKKKLRGKEAWLLNVPMHFAYSQAYFC